MNLRIVPSYHPDITRFNNDTVLQMNGLSEVCLVKIDFNWNWKKKNRVNLSPLSLSRFPPPLPELAGGASKQQISSALGRRLL